MAMYYPRDIARSWREYSKNTCFVLMPFDDKFRKVYSAILSELKKIHFFCTRVDLEDQDGAIINRIVKGIISSHFVIVDLSGRNPNVFYELGLSHALKDEPNVILISQSMDDVPFDIKHLRVIIYDIDDMFSLVERVRRQIDLNKHGFDIKLSLKRRYGHLLKNESELCDLEEFFEPFIYDYPYVLLNIAELAEQPPLDMNKGQVCISKIRNSIEIYVRSGGRIGNVLVKAYSDLLVALQIVPFVESETLKSISKGEIVDGFSNREKLKHVMNLVFDLFKSNVLKQEAIGWIIKYLSRPKVAGVDLNRSRVEEFVIYQNSHELNRQMLITLWSLNNLQRENISDILGEICDPGFASHLESSLENETDYYAARSMITALGKIGLADSGVHIVSWLKKNIEIIIDLNKEFVFHYTGPALAMIDHKNATNFVSEFNSILTSYGVAHRESK